MQQQPCKHYSLCLQIFRRWKDLVEKEKKAVSIKEKYTLRGKLQTKLKLIFFLLMPLCGYAC